jgi:hypothetical protein
LVHIADLNIRIINAATGQLIRQLTHSPIISTEVIAAARSAGISHSALYAARIELNVRLERVPGPGARHEWS